MRALYLAAKSQTFEVAGTISVCYSNSFATHWNASYVILMPVVGFVLDDAFNNYSPFSDSLRLISN